ncbi:uncharacterized protein LOC142179799 [Nicotiana tabacum]|uniref:Uncharacterized protein LOC142179799 n=1 Tax=Nicotiana tabacum TaxID=4097 RepID=A0AC58UBA0_TOBAC
MGDKPVERDKINPQTNIVQDNFADKLDTTFDYKNEVWSEYNILRSYPKKNGFTGQLHGWWDNYLTADERKMVINAIATDEGVDNLGMALVKNREDTVYTLVLTILEYFNESDYYYSESESEIEVDLLDLYDSDKNIDNTCTACREKPIKIDSQHDMFLGMMQIVTAHRCIDSKGFTATYKDKKISYIFVTDLEKIKLISENIAIDICAEHPSAFLNRKKHIVSLPYEANFSEDDIPTKSRPCQMNAELVEFCKKEIDNLLQKGWNPHGAELEVEEGEDHPHIPKEGHRL